MAVIRKISFVRLIILILTQTQHFERSQKMLGSCRSRFEFVSFDYIRYNSYAMNWFNNLFANKPRRIFLDYASATPVLPEVKQAMEKYWSEDFYNPNAIYAEGERVKKELEPGIYFDAGTGRGNGVEISVTNEKGGNLLHKVMPRKKVNRFGKHLLDSDKTNNYGELLACKYALQFALKNQIKKIFGDSKLVIDYWSQGLVRKKFVSAETIKLVTAVAKLRKKFEAARGVIGRISGDDNPADLGFH